MEKTFCSSKGVTIELMPVSQFKVNALRAAQVEIPVPTYAMKTVAGPAQEVPLDEKIAANTGRMDEWDAYVQAKHEADSENAQKFLELIIWEGVNVEVPGPESEWQKTCDYFGLKVPESPIERKLFYVHNELLGTSDDIGGLISDIMAASQVDEEAVRVLRDSFRIGIQRETNKRLPKTKGKVENKKPNV